MDDLSESSHPIESSLYPEAPGNQKRASGFRRKPLQDLVELIGIEPTAS
jgi:hypothetical protein